MEIETEIPMLVKSKGTFNKKQPATSSCCVPKAKASVCCNRVETPVDNRGACCAQPEDGSPCCDK